jgi:pyruvate dehydrogenase E2 component (dihydrolipoamide acetyltransferase)
VAIPDIGGDSAKVIEILVELGQKIELDDPLITLESDKASMEVPSTTEGTIKSIDITLDQDVTEGVVIVRVHSQVATTDPAEAKQSPEQTPPSSVSTAENVSSAQSSSNRSEANSAVSAAPAVITSGLGNSHASPSIRRFARELGVDLAQVSGSGRKNRISKDDVSQYVKGILSSKTSGPSETANTTGIPVIPAVDFSKFGVIEIKPLNKIKRLTASNLHRSWLNVPHVTHDDESNISDLDSFRKQLNSEYKEQNRDIKLSPLAFIVKAVVRALKAFPQFNSSLEPGGENLIYKNYYNIGIAVETPDGLVVPVLKNADGNSVSEIAQQMGELAAKARDKKLTMADMSGACITISSLGGIGGTHFTPIVNAPEVAILGVSRSKIQPVWNGSEFEPGMILPLSLSYDHRVIDGAEAARFTRFIASALEDVRRLTV